MAEELNCMAGCDTTPRDPAAMPTPGQLLHRLHTLDAEGQLDLVGRMLESQEAAQRCFVYGHDARLVEASTLAEKRLVAREDWKARCLAAEASRQAWAEEAMRCDFFAERMTLAAAKHDDMLRFVARRYLADGSGANFRSTRCTGVSSDALAWYAVGIRNEPMPEEYPRDPSDLAACERTYEMAPGFLRERMEPVLAKYRAAVAKDYPEAVPQCAVHADGRTSFCCDKPQPMGDAGEPDEHVVSCANCGDDMDPDMLERLRYAPDGSVSVFPEETP